MQGPSTFNTFIQIIITGAPGSGEFVYNPTATMLIYSNVNQATPDPLLGNTTLSGTTWYFDTGVVGSTRFLALNITGGGSAAFMQWYTAATMAGPWTTTSSIIQGQSTPTLLVSSNNLFLANTLGTQQGIFASAGGMKLSVNDVSSGGAAGSGNPMLIGVPQSSGSGGLVISGVLPPDFQHVSGVLVEVHGSQLIESFLQLKNLAAPAAAVGYARAFSIGGNVVFVNGLAGDGATYDTGRLSLFATGQTVNSLVFTPITGVGSFNLGIGTYRMHAKIVINTIVAGSLFEIKFVTGGGLVITGEATCRETKVPVGGGAVTWGQGNIISLSGAAIFSTSALGAANTVIDIDCMHAVVTTAGTLTPQVAVSNAAETCSILTDTYFEILPVN